MVSEFETWWRQEGSRPPAAEHDLAEHCKRMCEIAWKNGAFVEHDGCLKACEQVAAKYHMKRYATDWQAQECIAAIKARGQS